MAAKLTPLVALAGGAPLAVPRQDLDAEGALVAALFDGRALEVLELLRPEEYYADANRRIHEAARDVVTAGGTVDIVSVSARLRADGRYEQIGGSAYLATVIDQPFTLDLEAAARTVKDWARVRRASVLWQTLAAEAKASELPDVPAWLAHCEARAYAVTQTERESSGKASSYADSMAAVKARWAEQAAHKDARTWGTATGYHRLDEHTGGLLPGQLWYIAARPGQGKSAFLQQLIEYVAARGGGEAACLMASMEMSFDELSIRALARRANLSYRAVASGKVDNTGWNALAQATRDIATWPIVVDDEKRLSPMRLRAKVRRRFAQLREKHPSAKLRVIGVDYVQLMVSDQDMERRGMTRAEELGQVSSQLKALAGEFECTVIALSQVRRPEKGKAPPRPELDDMRDSGALEADGDVVISLHRPDQYRKGGEQLDGRCEVHVLKGRACGEASFELLYDGPSTHFSNLDVQQDGLWRERQ
jgi:replicative DNA helicase